MTVGFSDQAICGVYRITCVPTGRVYVGSSVDIKRGWVCRYASDSEMVWQRKIRKLLAQRRREAKKNVLRAGTGYIVTSPDGEEHLLPYGCLTGWCIAQGLNSHVIMQVARGAKRQHKGFVARKAQVA